MDFSGAVSEALAIKNIASGTNLQHVLNSTVYMPLLYHRSITVYFLAVY